MEIYSYLDKKGRTSDAYFKGEITLCFGRLQNPHGWCWHNTNSSLLRTASDKRPTLSERFSSVEVVLSQNQQPFCLVHAAGSFQSARTLSTKGCRQVESHMVCCLMCLASLTNAVLLCLFLEELRIQYVWYHMISPKTYARLLPVPSDWPLLGVSCAVSSAESQKASKHVDFTKTCRSV